MHIQVGNLFWLKAPPHKVTELQSEHLPATSRAVNVLAPQQPGQQFVFQTHRCCLRYHVLLQLLEELWGAVAGTMGWSKMTGRNLDGAAAE